MNIALTPHWPPIIISSYPPHRPPLQRLSVILINFLYAYTHRSSRTRMDRSYSQSFLMLPGKYNTFSPLGDIDLKWVHCKTYSIYSLCEPWTQPRNTKECWNRGGVLHSAVWSGSGTCHKCEPLWACCRNGMGIGQGRSRKLINNSTYSLLYPLRIMMTVPKPCK